MKIEITVPAPGHQLPPRIGGLWRCGRFFQRGTTVVEVVGGADPVVEVVVPNTLRTGATETRPDPERVSYREFVELSNDVRLVVDLPEGAPSDQDSGLPAEVRDEPGPTTTRRGGGDTP